MPPAQRTVRRRSCFGGARFADDSHLRVVVFFQALLRSLRVQLLSWGDAGKWRAVGEGKVVSLENELSVLRTVVGAVDKMLGLYPTTGADDGKLMAAHQQATQAAASAGDLEAQRAALQAAHDRGELLTARRIKAILLRYPEKAILLAVKLWCHQRWNQVLTDGFPSEAFPAAGTDKW